MMEGPIYPLGGTEVVAVLLSVAAWLAWTVWQARSENETYRREARELREGRAVESAVLGDGRPAGRESGEPREAGLRSER